jgi:hypothetical protein
VNRYNGTEFDTKSPEMMISNQLEEIKMRKWLQKLEKMAVAAAFAEEGEWQLARGILYESEKRSTARDIERKNQPKTRARERSYRV